MSAVGSYCSVRNANQPKNEFSPVKQCLSNLRLTEQNFQRFVSTAAVPQNLVLFNVNDFFEEQVTNMKFGNDAGLKCAVDG